MRYIDELIAEHCPAGVEFKTLRELVGHIPRGKRLTKTNLAVDGSIPVFHGGLDPIGFHDRANTPGRTVMIINTGASSGTVGWSDVEFWCSDGCFALPHSEAVQARYLYYYTVANQRFFVDRVRRAGIPTLAADAVLALRVPLPPLEVQREIVRILDQFTQLEAELEAELEARRRQYEHYRSSLLKFDLETVDTVILSDGFETRNGYTPAKSDSTNWTDGTVPWFRMEDIRENGRVLGRALQMIPEKAVKGGRYFPANSMIFATSATVGEHALITVPYMANQRFTAVWPKPEFADRFDMEFLFFYGFVIDEWCRRNTTTSSFASVDMSGFKRLVIPIPSMDDQRRIADRLDRFDALVNDLSVGLPAELAARRKQYEYYRDKLLTFKELAA